MAPLNIFITIIVAAPMVTSAAAEPNVSQVCVWKGNREVTCTSTEGNPRFIWRLNSQLLPSTSTITLQRDQSGNLTCEVSGRKASVHLMDCPAFPYGTVVIAGASLLFLLALSVCFNLLFRKPGAARSDGADVTYADVKIQAGRERREASRHEESVEYGQVRVHQDE